MEKSDILIDLKPYICYTHFGDYMREIFPKLENDINHALTYYAKSKQDSENLHILKTGHEICENNKKKCGPLSYAYYILHYVHKGKGYIEFETSSGEKKKIIITKGNMFIVFPNKVVTYYQDEKDPWEYSWVCFFVNNELDIISKIASSNNLVIEINDNPIIEKDFLKFQELSNYNYSKSTKALALTYDIFAEIIESKKNPVQLTKEKDYIYECLEYIGKNFKRSDLSANEIASHLGLNVKYLSRIFSSVMNESLFKYVTLLRIKEGLLLLTTTDYPIKIISRMVGYEDSLYFSKKIKSYVNMSPSEFRSKNREENNEKETI